MIPLPPPTPTGLKQALICRNLAEPLPEPLDDVVSFFLGGPHRSFYWPDSGPEGPRSVARAVRAAFRGSPEAEPSLEAAFQGLRYLSSLVNIAGQHGVMPRSGGAPPSEDDASCTAAAAAAGAGEAEAVELQQGGAAAGGPGAGPAASASSNSLSLAGIPDPGCVLVAHPCLNSGWFGRSVVLLCSHEPGTGSYGLCINKPLGSSMRHLAEQVSTGKQGGTAAATAIAAAAAVGAIAGSTSAGSATAASRIAAAAAAAGAARQVERQELLAQLQAALGINPADPGSGSWGASSRDGSDSAGSSSGGGGGNSGSSAPVAASTDGAGAGGEGAAPPADVSAEALQGLVDQWAQLLAGKGASALGRLLGWPLPGSGRGTAGAATALGQLLAQLQLESGLDGEEEDEEGGSWLEFNCESGVERPVPRPCRVPGLCPWHVLVLQ